MEIYEIHRDHDKTSYTLGGGGPAWGYLVENDDIYEWSQQWFQPKIFKRVYGEVDITVQDDGVWLLDFKEDPQIEVQIMGRPRGN